MEKRHYASIVIPDPAGDKNYSILRAPTDQSITIEKAYAVTDRDVAAHTANYFNVALMNGGTAGTGTTLIGGSAGGTAGWSLNVPKELTITAGSGKLTAGQWLVAKYDEEGTTAPGSVTVFVEFVDGIGSKANA